MAENDPLVIPITADLQPLFKTLETGLRQLRDKLAAAKDAGSVKLTADVDTLVKQMTGMTPRIETWAKDASQKAVVTPTVQGAPLTQEMAGLGHEVSYTLARSFNISPFMSRVIANASVMQGTWLSAIQRIGIALKGLKFAEISNQIKGFYGSLQEAAGKLDLVSKGLLIAGAAMLGWKFGRWISEISGLDNALRGTVHTMRAMTDAEAEAEAARIKTKYSIDMTNDAIRVFNSLTPQQRYELLQNAQAAGTLTLGMDELTDAIHRMNDAARQNTIRNMLQGEQKTFKEHVEYYSKSRMSQIAIDLSRVRIALQGNLTSEQRNKLQAEENRLLQQKAQEYVRINEAANRPGRTKAEKPESIILPAPDIANDLSAALRPIQNFFKTTINFGKEAAENLEKIDEDYQRHKERLNDLLLKDTKNMNKKELAEHKKLIDQELKATKSAMSADQAMQQAQVTWADMTGKQKVEIGASVASQLIGQAQAVFGESKALSIAQAIVNTAQGITSALAAPFPIDMWLPPVIGALGAAQVAKIAGVKFALGGLITQPTMALMGEAGAELVAPRQTFVDVIGDVISDAKRGNSYSTSNNYGHNRTVIINAPTGDSGLRELDKINARAARLGRNRKIK